MAVDFENAQIGLDNLIIYYQSNISGQQRNEATTRLHLIDRILFECLGWDRSDCIVEESFDSQYTDYSFHCPERLLIVEAKKEGTYFELPVGTTKLKYDIPFFKKYATSVFEAIKQAIDYCQSRGTPFGMVSNGHQLIAFIGSRVDGRPPIEGKALVFESLEMLRQHFLLAWQCLSKSGIQSRRLSIELQDVTIAPVPEKLSAKITGYPGFKARNPLQTDLQILSDLFIEDITRAGESAEEDEFIKQCYCSSGALSRYTMISKEILTTRYSAMYGELGEGPSTVPATTKKGINPELLAESLSKRPILLIGDVGVGKTMFIKHFYRVAAKDVFADAIVIYIDFGSIPTLDEEIETFVEKEIKTQLIEIYNIDIEERNFVRAILHGDLMRFEKGIYGDLRETDPETFRKKQIDYIEEKLQKKDDYIRKSLSHISKGQRKQIVIFLDNVDQRVDHFQEKVFLIGQTMADNWPVTVFISIRPETFYKSRAAGTLSAYHPRAFTIAPPRVDEVIARRLKYGVELLNKGIGLGPTSRISVQSSTLADYLNILVYSFSNNKYLIEFLDNMCGGNIRLALDFVRAFIGSGHVDTEKILKKYHEAGNYLVPLHEFLRAVTYVDHEYYSPQASVILNMFDILMPDGKEHFLVPIFLTQMDRWAQKSATDGFVHVADIYSYLQMFGYYPNQVSWAIQRLSYRNLLESAKPHAQRLNGGSTGFSEESHFRITSIGAYYVKRLITRFTYLDAVIVDTPILSAELRRQIANEFDIHERLVRAKLFADYLDSQWIPLPQQDLAFQWPAVRRLIDKDIEYITDKITVREDIIESK